MPMRPCVIELRFFQVSLKGSCVNGAYQEIRLNRFLNRLFFFIKKYCLQPLLVEIVV